VVGEVVPARIAVNGAGSDPSYLFYIYPLGYEGPVRLKYLAIPSFDLPVRESYIDTLLEGNTTRFLGRTRVMVRKMQLRAGSSTSSFSN